MLKSPATKYGYFFSRFRREDSGETEWGCGPRSLAYALPILKQGKFVLKQPCGVKTSNIIKSSVSGGKKGNTANFCKQSRDTEQATLGLAMGGAKDLKPETVGRKPLEERGSCRRRTLAGGPSARDGKQRKKHIPATQAVVLNEGEVGRGSQSMARGGVGFINHFRDEPVGLEGVTGGGGRERFWFVGGVWGWKGQRSGLRGLRE